MKLVRFYDVFINHYKVLTQYYTWLLWVFCSTKNELSVLMSLLGIHKVKQNSLFCFSQNLSFCFVKQSPASICFRLALIIHKDM